MSDRDVRFLNAGRGRGRNNKGVIAVSQRPAAIAAQQSDRRQPFAAGRREGANNVLGIPRSGNPDKHVAAAPRASTMRSQ